MLTCLFCKLFLLARSNNTVEVNIENERVTLVEKDHLDDWSLEKDRCLRLSCVQAVVWPTRQSNPLKVRRALVEFFHGSKINRADK